MPHRHPENHPDIIRRTKIAEELGWTDIRLVRMFGCGLVLRGLKPFVTPEGFHTATNENVPMFEELKTNP